jgi:hypothetical protein
MMSSKIHNAYKSNYKCLPKKKTKTTTYIKTNISNTHQYTPHYIQARTISEKNIVNDIESKIYKSIITI